MSELSEHCQAETSASAMEKTDKLSVEIARLIREGTTESRKKAQELLQKAIAEHSGRTAENKG